MGSSPAPSPTYAVANLHARPILGAVRLPELTTTPNAVPAFASQAHRPGGCNSGHKDKKKTTGCFVLSPVLEEAGGNGSPGWIRRTEESKTKVLEQLRGIIEPRSVPPPDGAAVASLDGGPFYDYRLSKLHWGTFATVRKFHEALIDDISLDTEYTSLPTYLTHSDLLAFYRQAGNELVLTHGELSSLNILLRGDEVVGIVDWETAEWFRPYREYTCANNVNPLNPFWADPVDQFLTPMPEELKMDTIRRKYFGTFWHSAIPPAPSSSTLCCMLDGLNTRSGQSCRPNPSHVPPCSVCLIVTLHSVEMMRRTFFSSTEFTAVSGIESLLKFL
ncbi:hypothetical protein RJ55_08262 [Drechmeria coniospora]|nr:hypothetical protein RJ55_08262 [Drechmeria coniospora]